MKRLALLGGGFVLAVAVAAVAFVRLSVSARDSLSISAATAAAAGRPTVMRPDTTGGYLAPPGIYAGPAPTGPLPPPPPGPGMLPTGFQSRTFYSMPQIDPALNATVQVSGSGPNGTVGPRGMQVDRVTPGSRLDSVYGLQVGDEIVEELGMSAADDAAVPTVVAKARMLAKIGSGNEIKVRRGGRLYYLMQDRPPGMIP